MVRLGRVLAWAGVLASATAELRARHIRASPGQRRLRRDNNDAHLHRMDSSADQDDVIHGAYVVELQDSASAADLASELSAVNITIKTRRTLDYKLFQGVSFDIVDSDSLERAADAIDAVAAVKKLWPVRKITLPANELKHRIYGNSTTSDDAQRRRALERPYNPHVMTQVDRLHEAGYTGKGLNIAVIDTGIDYNHPILGGCFGPGCKVTHGWDSVGVDHIPDDGTLGEPRDDPMDCDGHGTHVAGIIAADPNDFGFLGAAPDAELGAYRVLDCGGVGTEESVVLGMLRAFEDGNDIITMSLGAPAAWPEDIMSYTATRIIEAGVPVFVAAGNSEFEFETMFETSSPADGEHVTSVASFNLDEEPVLSAIGEYSINGNDSIPFGWHGHWWWYYDDVKEATFPVIDINSFVYSDGTGNGSRVDGCSRLPPSVPDLSGAVVLIEPVDRWDCDFYDQQQNIVARGGDHILFRVPFESPIQEFQLISCGRVFEPVAKEWTDALAAGSNVTITMALPAHSEIQVDWLNTTRTGGYVADTSVWGPNWDMRSTPSFGAPGHNILSTVSELPQRLGIQGLGVYSGTSMSTPLVAAAAALLSQARGTSDPKTLHNILASTSKQAGSLDSYALEDGPAPPTQQGSGLIQLWDAAQVKGVVSTSSISFNDSDHHVKTVKFTILNTGDEEATYQLGHSPAVTTYALGPQLILSRGSWETTATSADISFDSAAVTVSAGTEAEITVHCTPPQGVDISRWPIYSGYLTLSGTNGDSLVVPYVGNAGSMRNAMILTPGDAWLSIGGWDLGLGVRPGFVFTIPKPGDEPTEVDIEEVEVPVLFFGTWAPSRLIRVDLLPASSSSNITSSCNPARQEWLGRKSYGQVWGSPFVNVGTDFLVLPFTGFLVDGSHVPPGKYSFLISALRLFADTESTGVEDWQAVQIVDFGIEYEA